MQDNNQTDIQHNNTSVKNNVWKDVLSFLKTAIIFILLWLFIRGTIIEAFKIPSGSMIPTLQIGDYLLVNKLSYGVRLPFVDETVWQYDTPKRGDVVVFTKDYLDDGDFKGMNFIKRVIAVGGDTLEVKNRVVYINGKATKEDYAQWTYGGLISGEVSKITIPKDHIFLMGDNRDNSKDSRYWKKPFLPISRVKGRALIIYWSFFDLKRIFTLIR